MNKTMLLDSTEAISRVRAGDAEAFAQIVEQFQSPIVNYLFRLTGDIELVEISLRTPSSRPTKDWLAIGLSAHSRRGFTASPRILLFSTLGGKPKSRLCHWMTAGGPLETAIEQTRTSTLPPFTKPCCAFQKGSGSAWSSISSTASNTGRLPGCSGYRRTPPVCE